MTNVWLTSKLAQEPAGMGGDEETQDAAPAERPMPVNPINQVEEALVREFITDLTSLPAGFGGAPPFIEAGQSIDDQDARCAFRQHKLEFGRQVCEDEGRSAPRSGSE